MPCNIVSPIPPPTLPLPLTFGGAIPLTPPISVAAPCCSQPLFELAPISIPLPTGAINPAFIATIEGYLEAFDALLEQLVIPCPRDGAT